MRTRTMARESPNKTVDSIWVEQKEKDEREFVTHPSAVFRTAINQWPIGRFIYLPFPAVGSSPLLCALFRLIVDGSRDRDCRVQ